MKKNMFLILVIIFCSCLFFCSVKAEETPLNQILITQGKFNQESIDIIQKKIIALESSLKLTDNQKQSVKNIALESSKKINIYNVKYINEKKNLIDMKKTGADSQLINKQKLLIKSLKARLAITTKKNMNEFENILSTEQQVIFNQFKIEMRQLADKDKIFVREDRKVQTRDEKLKDADFLN